MSLDAMKQALEALEELADEVFAPYDNKLGDAILALRAAIEDAEKPWVKSYAGGKPNYTVPEEQEPGVTLDASAPLVVQPHPAFKKWQGLTDEEITEIAATPAAIPGSYVFSFARAIEAKLKEKNHG